jgi:type VI secretion system secreted protein VgrG
MGNYSQANRPFRAVSTLGADELLLLGFQGREGISIPFEFTVDLLSEDPRIDGKALLLKPLVIEMDTPDGETRYIHGLIRRFSQLGRHEALVSYRAEVVPWLWFLTLGTDCRVFQNLHALEIIQKIFSDNGFSDFELRVSRTPKKRDYCVQYRETHFDFVSRLMEEEGIFYFFEHTDSKHVLVITDNAGAHKPVPHQPTVELVVHEGKYFDQDVITNLESIKAFHTGAVTLRDYDPLQPSVLLEAEEKGTYKPEDYDYPGKFTVNADGTLSAKMKLQEYESHQHVLVGKGNVRAFTSGFRFDLEGHYNSALNGSYVLTRIEHAAQCGDFRTWKESDFSYANTFHAIPRAIPFRPPATPRPVVKGSQTAVVVGPAGEEIFVDKYGRVKVQFFWDRLGKKDDKSSCWIRVSSTWAGKGWGFIQIPRIGQEVVVDFLEGDPDQPLITGRVYNAEQVPPYSLPANQTQSGTKSRSSKGGGTEDFNEIRFEDKKGQEELYIHAQKDELHEVENDRTRTVGHDEDVTVDNDQSIDVKRHRTRNVGKNEDVTIGQNQTITVNKNQSLTVVDNRTKSVGKDETTDIGNNRTETVGKDESITINGNRTEQVKKDEKVDIDGKRELTVGKDELISIGKKYVLTAGEEIVLKTGSASITMKKDGTITIKGKDISIDASGKINAKASGTVTMKGSTIGQN